jgi:hypothetical protein
MQHLCIRCISDGNSLYLFTQSFFLTKSIVFFSYQTNTSIFEKNKLKTFYNIEVNYIYYIIFE